MRFIEVKFSNGEIWRVNAEEVADRYVEATLDNGRGTEEWVTLFDEILKKENEEKLIEFASTLDWNEFEEFSYIIHQPDLFDYQQEWPAIQKTIVSDGE